MSPLDAIRSMGRPLAYYPAMAKHVGGINAAIFLGQLMYWDERTDNALGVHKTSEQWEDETGLTAKQQALVRSSLKKLGLLIETHRRLEHRIYFKLDHDAFNELMKQINAKKSDSETNLDEQDSEGNGEQSNGQMPNTPKVVPPNDQRAVREQTKGKPPVDPKVNPLIDTEITAETTTEITCDSPKRSAYSKSFNRFWTAYPNTSRRVAKSKCFDVWKRKKLELIADDVVGHVEAMAKTKQWMDGYEPAPLTYLNQDRWEDGLPTPQQHTSPRNGGSALYDQNMAAAEEAKRMLFGDDDEAV